MEKDIYAEIKADVKALKKATLACLREGKLPEAPIPQPEE
jgi:hypothetical protein